MDTFWGLSATAWTAIYTFLTFGLLVTAIVTAVVALCQRREAQQAQIEAMRPYVLVTAEASAASMHLIDLAIRNIGQRPAKNVRISFDPPPVRARETREDATIAKIKLLTEPIAMVAPNQELRTFWDNQIDRNKRDDLPTFHTVNITYEDTSGQHYYETSTIDLAALEGTMAVQLHNLHTIGKSLEEITRTLKEASVLTRSGQLEVHAVTEGYCASLPRAEREAALQTRHRLETELWAVPLLASITDKDARTAEIERQLAQWELEHPELVERESSRNEAPDRAQRLSAWWRRMTAGRDR